MYVHQIIITKMNFSVLDVYERVRLFFKFDTLTLLLSILADLEFRFGRGSTTFQKHIIRIIEKTYSNVKICVINIMKPIIVRGLARIRHRCTYLENRSRRQSKCVKQYVTRSRTRLFQYARNIIHNIFNGMFVGSRLECR